MTVKNRILRIGLAALAAASLVATTACAGEEAPKEVDGDRVVQEARDALPADIRDSGVLVLATDPSYAPCQSEEEDGTIVGFEVDIWDELGARLGLEVDVQVVQFDSLIPGVTGERFNVAMECLSDSLERQETVTFVDYALSAGATVTLESNPHGISDDPMSLCGLRTAVQVGTDFITDLRETISPACEEAGKSPVEINEFPTNDAVKLALYSGRVDFIIQDSFGASLLVDSAPEPVVVFGNEMVPALLIGAVVKKGNDELANALLIAFQSMFDDGTYHSIMADWNIPEEALIEAPGINLVTE